MRHARLSVSFFSTWLRGDFERVPTGWRRRSNNDTRKAGAGPERQDGGRAHVGQPWQRSSTFQIRRSTAWIRNTEATCGEAATPITLRCQVPRAERCGLYCSGVLWETQPPSRSTKSYFGKRRRQSLRNFRSRRVFSREERAALPTVGASNAIIVALTDLGQLEKGALAGSSPPEVDHIAC